MLGLVWSMLVVTLGPSVVTCVNESHARTWVFKLGLGVVSCVGHWVGVLSMLGFLRSLVLVNGQYWALCGQCWCRSLCSQCGV